MPKPLILKTNMEALRALVAREIDKASVLDAVNVVIHDSVGSPVSQSQQEGMTAGDFYLRPNVITRYEPASWFRRVFLGQKEKMITNVVITIIMSCPFCGLPLMTSTDNRILSRNPLTLDKPVRCPYSSHDFSIKDGNIMPA